MGTSASNIKPPSETTVGRIPYPMAEDVVVGEQLFGKRFSIYVTEITKTGSAKAEVRDFISLTGNTTPPKCTIDKSEDGKRWWATWSNGEKEIVCTKTQFEW